MSRIIKINFLFLVLFTSSLGLSLTTNNEIKLALVNYPISYNLTPNAFYEKVENFVRQAALEKADLVVFPELISFDLVKTNHIPMSQQTYELASLHSPVYLEKLKAWSEQYQITIFGGSTPWIVQNELEERVFNRSFLVFPNKQIIEQDKNFLTREEESYGWRASSEGIQIHDTPLGRLAILICYDVEFPKITQALAKEAPEMLIVPSMTSEKGFHRVRVTSQARAVEQHAYVVVTGTTNAQNTHHNHYHGNTAVYEPYEVGYNGIRLSSALNTGELYFSTIDLRKIRATKKSADFYPGRDQTR